ncbi:MAG: precorrin-3B methylase, partial [Sneathiella sp.]
MTPPTAIILLNDSGRETADKLLTLYPDALIHGLSGRVDDADVTFQQTAAHLQELFRAGTPILGICASAILIRCLAPALNNKLVEPPVVAVADDGSNIVPLLGGHHGANDLARDIADALQGHAAVTTASDVHFNIALDDPPAGLAIANPQHMKAFMAAMLSGETVKLHGTNEWLGASNLPFDEAGALSIHVTTKSVAGNATTLVYHPKSLALGVGCERGAEPDELLSLVTQTLRTQGLSPLSVGCITSIDLKS